MNWKSLGKGAVDTAVNIATDKATGQAANFLVQKFGPHRIFQKFGLASAGVGLFLIAVALIFGKLQLLLISLGVLGIAFGAGLYLLNGLVISLVSSLIKRISTNLWNKYFGQKVQANKDPAKKP